MAAKKKAVDVIDDPVVDLIVEQDALRAASEEAENEAGVLEFDVLEFTPPAPAAPPRDVDVDTPNVTVEVAPGPVRDWGTELDAQLAINRLGVSQEPQTIEEANQRIFGFWVGKGQPGQFSLAGRNYLVERHAEGVKFIDIGATQRRFDDYSNQQRRRR